MLTPCTLCNGLGGTGCGCKLPALSVYGMRVAIGSANPGTNCPVRSAAPCALCEGSGLMPCAWCFIDTGAQKASTMHSATHLPLCPGCTSDVAVAIVGHETRNTLLELAAEHAPDGNGWRRLALVLSVDVSNHGDAIAKMACRIALKIRGTVEPNAPDARSSVPSARESYPEASLAVTGLGRGSNPPTRTIATHGEVTASLAVPTPRDVALSAVPVGGRQSPDYDDRIGAGKNHGAALSASPDPEAEASRRAFERLHGVTGSGEVLPFGDANPGRGVDMGGRVTNGLDSSELLPPWLRPGSAYLTAVADHDSKCVDTDPFVPSTCDRCGNPWDRRRSQWARIVWCDACHLAVDNGASSIMPPVEVVDFGQRTLDIPPDWITGTCSGCGAQWTLPPDQLEPGDKVLCFACTDRDSGEGEPTEDADPDAPDGWERCSESFTNVDTGETVRIPLNDDVREGLTALRDVMTEDIEAEAQNTALVKLDDGEPAVILPESPVYVCDYESEKGNPGFRASAPLLPGCVVIHQSRAAALRMVALAAESVPPTVKEKA